MRDLYLNSDIFNEQLSVDNTRKPFIIPEETDNLLNEQKVKLNNLKDRYEEKVEELANSYKDLVMEKSYQTKKDLGIDKPKDIADLLRVKTNSEIVKLNNEVNRALDSIDTKPATYEEEVEFNCRKNSVNSSRCKIVTKSRKMTKKEIALRLIVFCVATGLTTKATMIAINNYKDKKIVKEIVKDYKYNIYDENTNIEYKPVKTSYDTEEGTTIEKEVITPVHSHDIDNMISDTYKKYEDPIMAFYLLYQNLDYSCKTSDIEFNYFLNSFNKLYGTNYTSYNDFLLSNNFSSTKELQQYIVASVKENLGRR